MIMEETNIPDYKLDEGFLKEFMFELLEKPSVKDLTIRLPVIVQVIKVMKITATKSLYFLADGEFEMSKCVFTSKQTKAECFSILKVTKISKLNDNSLELGKIEFDTIVSGEQIACPLYKDLKLMNMKELAKRKQEIGLKDLKKTFETPKPMEIMKHMWENRSETLCDVNFTFDNEGDVLFAHRSVLVAASEVFKAHSDNVGFIDTKSVHIVDSSCYSFNKLLEFIYTGKVQFTSWKLAFQLLYLSKKYLISNLENICQRVIKDFSDFDAGNLLNVFEQNKETNDEMLQNHVERNVYGKIYEVINSKSFLNCEFSTVEWIFSLDLVLDEWSRLCAIYKWAVYNKVAAFCRGMTDETDECLHALLECVHYENIDGLSLKRFFKLPKLTEIIDVGELKQNVFDSVRRVLEHQSYLECGTNFYPMYRGTEVSFLVEIEIGNSKDRYMKNIPLSRNGPVLGFKIKIEQQQENVDNEDHSMDLVLSFQYLYSFVDNNKDIQVQFDIKAITTKSRISERNEDNLMDRIRLSQGKWQDYTLHLEDCRGYLSSKIEDFSENCGRESIISLQLELSDISQRLVS